MRFHRTALRFTNEDNTQNISDLNVVASAVNADTLAIVTRELIGEAGTQLQLDADNKEVKSSGEKHQT